MLHRYRSVMVRPGRDRLTGDVEVDEAFLGGPEPGVPGCGALGKVLFAAAGPEGLGRARLGVIEDASGVFRFNRRHSRSRGRLFQRLLQQGVDGDALTYNNLRKAGRTRPPPPPPAQARWLPPSLEREESGLPCWFARD